MMESNALSASTFRVAAVVISLTCMIYTLIMRVKRNTRGKLFMMLLLITIIDSLEGIVSELFYVDAVFLSSKIRIIVCSICEMVYYSTHFALAVFFLYYIIQVCDVMYKVDKKIKLYIFVPITILEILLFTNPFTHIAFTIDENLTFSRGPLVYAAYALSGLYLLTCIYLLFIYWKTINSLKKIAMFYFLILTFAGIIIQMLFPFIVCELMVEAIGLMGIMIMIEKEDDRLDSSTKAYDRKTLLHDLNTLVKMKRKFKIICIRIDNAAIYRRITGYENFDRILIDVADFLIHLDVRYNVYRNGDANFYIICPDVNDKDAEKIAHRIIDRFEAGFISQNSDTRIHCNILLAGYPEHFSNVNDIVLMSEAPINLEGDRNFIYGDKLEYLLRTIDVENAISSAFSENKFKVYYRPIYGKECGCLKAAHALLNLEDSDLGDVDFNEYMPVAERTGFAEELQFMLIEAVFEFIGNDVNKGYMDVDFVIIPIMAAKVLNRNLIVHVEKMLEKYKVDSSIIAFSISDTIAALAEQNLEYIINSFYDDGVKLFFSGHENGGRGISIDVMDKFYGVLLSCWNFLKTDKRKQGTIIMKARTNMLAQLGKKIVITGVDNTEFFDDIKEMTGEYMTGNHFSEALTKNELQNKFWNNDKVTPSTVS